MSEFCLEDVVGTIDRIANSRQARCSLSPSERDEVRGEMVMAFVRLSRGDVPPIRDSARLGAYLWRVATRKHARIRSRPAIRRPLLEAALATDAQASPLDNFSQLATECAGQPPEREAMLGVLARGTSVLTSLQYRVLWSRYFVGESWRRVAEKIGRTRNATRRIHERAVASLQRSLTSKRPQRAPLMGAIATNPKNLSPSASAVPY